MGPSDAAPATRTPNDPAGSGPRINASAAVRAKRHALANGVEPVSSRLKSPAASQLQPLGRRRPVDSDARAAESVRSRSKLLAKKLLAKLVAAQLQRLGRRGATADSNTRADTNADDLQFSGRH